MERQFGNFKERGGVNFGFVVKSEHHGVIHGLLAETANARIGKPEERMPPICDLEERLGAVDPGIAPAEVDEFVQENGAELGTRQFVRERSGQENEGTEKTANSGREGLVGKTEPDGIA